MRREWESSESAVWCTVVNGIINIVKEERIKNKIWFYSRYLLSARG